MYIVPMKQLISTLTALLFFTSTVLADTNITDQEALDYAKQIEQSVIAEDADFLNNLFDKDVFTQLILKRMDKPEPYMKTAIHSGIDNIKMGDRIISAVKDDGFYRLVKLYEKDGTKHLLFRLYTGSALNYHDMELVKGKKSLKVADLYIYLSGESMSYSMGELLNRLMDSKNATAYNIGEVAAFVKSGQYNLAASAYKRLDKKIKDSKIAQIINLQILSGTGEEKKYLNALGRYQKMYPNDPSLPLVLVDYHILKGQYTLALDDINSLDDAINKDPFLDYHRGIIYNNMKDSTSALVCFERLYKNMPEFKDGMLELLVNYLLRHKYDEAKPLIADYKNKYGDSDFKILTIAYPDFEEYLLYND